MFSATKLAVFLAALAGLIIAKQGVAANLIYDESPQGNLENFPMPLDNAVDLGILGLGVNTVRGNVGREIIL
jgi:hypothetical protein